VPESTRAELALTGVPYRGIGATLHQWERCEDANLDDRGTRDCWTEPGGVWRITFGLIRDFHVRYDYGAVSIDDDGTVNRIDDANYDANDWPTERS
jgi:hypothetical protein